MVDAISIHHHHHAPLPPPEPESHSQPLFATNRHLDTSSKATANFNTITVNTGSSILLIDGRITIGQFADAVQLSLVNSRTALHRNDFTNFLTNKKIGQGQADMAQSLQATREAIAALQQQQATLVETQNQQINAQNTQITTYNNIVNDTMPSPNSDQLNVDAMNQAISDYNSGAIDVTEFNTAVDTYNAYVDSRNAVLQSFRDTYNASVSTFQGQVAANNATIAEFNEAGAAYHIPPIPAQTDVPAAASPFPNQASGPLSIPVPAIPNPPPPEPTLANVPPPPSQADFLHNYWDPIVNLAMIGLAITDRRQDIHQANTDFNTFFIRGKHSTQANAFSSNVPPIFFDSSGGISGGSTGIATAPIGTGVSPHLSGLISSGLSQANAKQFNIQMTQPLLTHLTLFGMYRSSNNGIAAALPALRLIGAGAATSGDASTAFGVALGITNAQLTADQINSGEIKQTIAGYVNAELKGKVDQNTIDRTIEVLTAQTNLFLLATALLVGANTIKLPGLPGQIFGNVAGVTPENLQRQAPQTIGQVLNDPLKQAFLKSSLSTQLTQDTNIQLDQAQTLINTAINNALAQGPVRTGKEFKQRLIQQLTASGVDRHEAVILANQAQSILSAEKTSQHIVNGDLFDRTTATDQLTTQLTKQGYNEVEARQLAEAAIAQTQNNAAITNATEYQIALNRALENLNVGRSKAQEASSSTVAALNVVPSGTSPVFNPFSQTTLSPAELGREINAYIVQTLAPIVGPEKARQIADHAVSTLVGVPSSDPHQQPAAVRPPGLLALINENASILRRYGNPRQQERITNQFRDFTRPNVDLFVFSNKLTNPAYTFLHTAATGLMYTPHTDPTKDKKSIDIQV